MDSDVIIVGGGPVGMGLAIDLALQGLSSIIVERHEKIQRIPKGQNLTPRTGEHFRRWGVTEAIRAASPIPHNYASGGMASYRTFLSEHHYDFFNRSKIIDYYAATNERLPQYETEAVLRARADTFNEITLLTGWSFESLDQNSASVRVTICKTHGAESRELSAPFLVGCDGSRSPVRIAAGITQTEDSHDQRMALLVFQSSELDEKLVRYGEKIIYNAINPEMKGYWQFLGRVDLEGNWFFHAPVPAGTTRENYDFQVLLDNSVGEPIDAKFSYVGFWDLRMSLADDFRNGRVFIAGDAAHSHPPYGGYGVNTGLEDARNLAWKLAAVCSGWGGENLLGSYTEERHPVFASTRDDFIMKSILEDRAFVEAYDPTQDAEAFELAWNQRATGDDSMVTQYLPNYAGSPIVCGAIGAQSGATGNHSFEATIGHHLAPVQLSSGEGFWDKLGSFFTLINLAGNSEWAVNFDSAANSRGIPLNVLNLGDQRLREAYDVEAILVRPDDFIAWSGSCEGSEAVQILDRAVGA